MVKHFECRHIGPPQEVQCVHMYSVAWDVLVICTNHHLIETGWELGRGGGGAVWGSCVGSCVGAVAQHCGKSGMGEVCGESCACGGELCGKAVGGSCGFVVQLYGDSCVGWSSVMGSCVEGCGATMGGEGLWDGCFPAVCGELCFIHVLRL